MQSQQTQVTRQRSPIRSHDAALFLEVNIKLLVQVPGILSHFRSIRHVIYKLEVRMQF